MSSDTAIQRRPNGTWTPGQSGNPKGGAVGRRRFIKAVERKLEDPDCIETMADNFIRGLEDPDAHPVIGRIAWDRFIPSNSGRVGDESASDAAPNSSAQQWDAIAERAGGEVPAVADLALVQLDAIPEQGAD